MQDSMFMLIWVRDSVSAFRALVSYYDDRCAQQRIPAFVKVIRPMYVPQEHERSYRCSRPQRPGSSTSTRRVHEMSIEPRVRVNPV
jgi:hypothetical protein